MLNRKNAIEYIQNFGIVSEGTCLTYFFKIESELGDFLVVGKGDFNGNLIFRGWTNEMTKGRDFEDIFDVLMDVGD